jgi:hypothetical protein
VVSTLPRNSTILAILPEHLRQVAMILDHGAPIELMEFELPDGRVSRKQH